MRNTKNYSITFIKFVIACSFVLLAFLLSIFLGAQKIPFSSIFAPNTFQKTILWQLRLPRSLLVLLTGLLLGGSGAVFQLFFRNPLAEPGILGITSGATLSAIIASVLIPVSTVSALSSVIPVSPVNLAAFLGALLAGLIVTFLAFTKTGKNSSIMLLLCGTALGTLYSSLGSAILYTSTKELRGIFSWILGSFNGRGWNELFIILIPAVVCVLVMFLISPSLDLMNGGEESAKSLGLDVSKLRILVLICGALAVSAGVCAGGTIAFVGLIAPHIVRKIIGPKAKLLIPFSMLSGAFLLLCSDTLARILIAPAELPAGIITSILGVPFFLVLCLKGNRS